jgi:hypothetical protein
MMAKLTNILGGISMGVSKYSQINFEKISAEMGWVSERWFNGTISIVDPNLDSIVWDEWTNTSTGSETVLWTGAARIQPVGADTDNNAGRAVLGGRRVRFQVPRDDTRVFVRKGLSVRVVDGGQFANLEKLDFTVSAAINSSYAWLLTIECEADIKSELD